MKGLDNGTIKLVASDVNDLIKEGGHSQLAVIATSGVALTLQAIISAKTADELPYMVTSNVRSLLRELDKPKTSSDFELGFMLAVSATAQAITETDLTQYTKKHVLEVINAKLGDLKGVDTDE
ncbi:hypothetical protein M2M32_02880 [Weissella cibaria]|uniref:hypothetical protein n=1 Tax=Weissella TaxID=46255 RepID=UPI00107F8436|nr:MULTISPECIES: hypothetical protein [Weissella]MCA1354696.1 hypothetical protein [Weissella cibaria]MDQ2125027.1 hypothetical protein [Weissella cibaria]MDQ2157942.1 hypothetical protein [Weissella cibaria]TGE83537.1 hypothetical protein C6P10_01130 [Weissella confusa]TVV38982.1 hypothetical protein FO437_09945 [Weissella cibaria]